MSKMNDAQRDLLIHFMEENPKFAVCRGTSFTKEEFDQVWLDLSHRLNNLGGAKKTVKQWRRSWTDLKILSRKKAAIIDQQILKAERGLALAELVVNEEGQDYSKEQDFAVVTLGANAEYQDAHERILSIIRNSEMERVCSITDSGIDQFIASESDEESEEPIPKRPNLGEGLKESSKPNKETMSMKKELTSKWLENSRRKVEATEKVAEALNNIATQISRIANSFELYNTQLNE